MNTLYTELYSLSHEVTERLEDSKYVDFALQFNKNYRFLTIGDVLNSNLGGNLPPYLLRFIGEAGAVMCLPSFLNQSIHALLLRSLKRKEFRVGLVPHSPPYRIGSLASDFHYGDLLVCVEGAFDADVLSFIYPNVIASLTAGLSSFHLSILPFITDKFLLLFDSDEPGRKAVFRNYSQLKRKGLFPFVGDIYPGDKDPGDMFSYRQLDKPYDSLRYDFYHNQIYRIISK